MTISLSAIIAAIWAGIWGFNWAATHLDGGALFISIIIGLGVGAWLTYHFVERSFNTVDTLEQLYYRAVAAAAANGQDPKSIPPPPGIILKLRWDQQRAQWTS
ncbi:MAG: hypothetical protein ABSB97_06575 [Thermoplasmata archaeon]